MCVCVCDEVEAVAVWLLTPIICCSTKANEPRLLYYFIIAKWGREKMDSCLLQNG